MPFLRYQKSGHRPLLHLKSSLTTVANFQQAWCCEISISESKIWDNVLAGQLMLTWRYGPVRLLTWRSPDQHRFTAGGPYMMLKSVSRHFLDRQFLDRQFRDRQILDRQILRAP